MKNLLIILENKKCGFERLTKKTFDSNTRKYSKKKNQDSTAEDMERLVKEISL